MISENLKAMLERMALLNRTPAQPYQVRHEPYGRTVVFRKDKNAIPIS